VRLRRAVAHSQPWPYGGVPEPTEDGEGFDVPLVPYHDWAERGPSTMRVWLPGR
jgi:DUF1680 family protein